MVLVSKGKPVITEAISLDWMTLAAPDVDRLGSFYEETLRLSEAGGAPDIAGPSPSYIFETPPGTLCMRELTTMPSGGVHTHFAIAVSPARYERITSWLGPNELVTERTFGGNRSLYGFDPAGHCFEFGERDGVDGAVGQIFEVVLEVDSLERALDRYTPLGFEPLGSDDTRRRRRLRGPFDLELWEPQLGIADARGGCHVDLGLTVADPTAAADHLTTADREPARIDGRLFVRDGDGHTWWLDSPD